MPECGGSPDLHRQTSRRIIQWHFCLKDFDSDKIGPTLAGAEGMWNMKEKDKGKNKFVIPCLAWEKNVGGVEWK